MTEIADPKLTPPMPSPEAIAAVRNEPRFILMACPEYAGFVPEAMRPVTVAGLAKRLHVSRMHVRSMLRDAENAGFLIRHGDTAQVTVLPALIGVMERFFASALVMGETCATLALAQE